MAVRSYRRSILCNLQSVRTWAAGSECGHACWHTNAKCRLLRTWQRRSRRSWHWRIARQSINFAAMAGRSCWRMRLSVEFANVCELSQQFQRSDKESLHWRQLWACASAACTPDDEAMQLLLGMCKTGNTQKTTIVERSFNDHLFRVWAVEEGDERMQLLLWMCLTVMKMAGNTQMNTKFGGGFIDHLLRFWRWSFRVWRWKETRVRTRECNFYCECAWQSWRCQVTPRWIQYLKEVSLTTSSEFGCGRRRWVNASFTVNMLDSHEDVRFWRWKK